MDEKLMKELGFANLDFLRKERTGAPEAIFCPGKKPEQVAEIMTELMKDGDPIMATRATENDYAAVKKLIPEAVYHEAARIISVNFESPEAEGKGLVAVVTAGTADIPVAEEAAVASEMLGLKVDRIYDVGVAGIHRLFEKLDRIRAAEAVIVVAGMEGALASVVGGLVETPVIAVPTSIGYGANLGGLSALLSMLNSCANGVGIVNIDNGYGAACLVAKMMK
ncbi:MAG: nickel pincer cofactor biosynthesis protein LarB [Firmicutes bacterium]|nr:nickel pincer cofactor biosynthesis protein LarB [Bacillota bacterium]